MNNEAKPLFGSDQTEILITPKKLSSKRDRASIGSRVELCLVLSTFAFILAL